MNFWKSWNTIEQAVNQHVLIKFEDGHIESALVKSVWEKEGFFYIPDDGKTLRESLPYEWAWIPNESDFEVMP